MGLPNLPVLDSLACTGKDGDLAGLDPRIQLAVALIRESQVAQVGAIAHRVNLSDSRFRHLFKKELGISLGHYIRLVRLKRARDLFASSFLRVKEVAVLVNANDISHFVRDYKLLYGQTPSETRRLSRGSVENVSRIDAGVLAIEEKMLAPNH